VAAAADRTWPPAGRVLTEEHGEDDELSMTLCHLSGDSSCHCSVISLTDVELYASYKLKQYL